MPAIKRFTPFLLFLLVVLQPLFIQKTVYADNQYSIPIIYIDKGNYRLGVDRNTGTIYELYNKRSDPTKNIIHLQPGAALQVAVFNGWQDSETKSPCLGQGFWNPTQAGAGCLYPSPLPGQKTWASPIAGQDLNVYCDNILNNSCTTAASSIHHSAFRLMNFDYGPNYVGPYNANDLLYFEQNISAKDNYFQVDFTTTNKRSNLLASETAITVPVTYLVDPYKLYSYKQINGNIHTSTFTQNTVLDGSKSEPKMQGNFITISDPQKSNSAITIAWFYSPEFKEDLQYPYNSIDNQPFNDGTGTKNYIMYTNAPRFILKTNKPYRFRYIIFPFPYDTTIQTEYGTMTVLQYIEKLNTTTNLFPVETPTVTPTDISAANCSGAGPTANPRIAAFRTTYTTYAYNVTNTSSIKFATWSTNNGQDDLVWYDGVNISNNTWQTTIDFSKHKDLGQFNVHVYLNGSILCGTANFIRNKNGDLNSDDLVNIFDYSTLVSNYGKSGTPYFTFADINGDGSVGIGDYNLFVEYYLHR